ncbi:MAG: FaeA/PapI family transcriptional regulator [Nanoarchaeota archaeon]|nr:FaeA/PapI family transcriptional regulator [Nanoarchaeota archaeon]
MPADIAKLIRDKEIIMAHINKNGPSLPVHLARAANLSILFASAFLSELYSEGKIKMSNMKVGSSSLYYIQGQEQQLENFIDYLNQKEKEAFHLLKSKRILVDSEQTPPIRVALRAIKDFAIPLRVKVNEEEKLMWKYFALEESEFNSLLQGFSPQKEEKVEKEGDASEEKQKTIAPNKEESKEVTSPQKKEIKKEKETDFIKKTKYYLEKKDLEIISIFLEKKKELLGIIRANSLFGKQEYYLIAKDKKKITEVELDLALEKSQAEKMPVLIMAPGELDKKASMRILGLRNLIKFINPEI